MNTRRLRALVALLLFPALGFTQTVGEHLKPFAYLLGEYRVEVFTPDRSGQWMRNGEGEASFVTTLGGTFIEESVATAIGNTTLTMKNTLGVDLRTSELRYVATDKEFGNMDFYNGEAEGAKIMLSNIMYDDRFVTREGARLAFRLTFQPLDDREHELIVEFTSDEGKQWNYYAKYRYIPK